MTQSVTVEKKIGLYELAIQLFESGKSHPQIVEILRNSVDNDTALVITDKAFRNEWNQLHEEAARLLLKKRSWYEVVEDLSKKEPYRDVVEYLVNDIYSREFDVMHAEDKFKKKFGIWGYLLIMGIIQLIRYFIKPYNEYYFWISMIIGIIGLCWGIWEFFLNGKDDNAFIRFSMLKKFEQNEQSKQDTNIVKEETTRGS